MRVTKVSTAHVSPKMCEFRTIEKYYIYSTFAMLRSYEFHTGSCV